MEVKRRGHKPCTVTSSSCCLQTKHQLFKKVRREGVSLLAYSFVACLLAGSLEQQEQNCDGIQGDGGKHQQLNTSLVLFIPNFFASRLGCKELWTLFLSFKFFDTTKMGNYHQYNFTCVVRALHCRGTNVMKCCQSFRKLTCFRS